MSEPDDLTAQEEQVRRLLAEARHTQPVPDDVAARLDAVLADLRDEDPADPVPVAVTRPPADLAAARRRRHNVRSWLVAAAAVVVVGIGVNQVAQTDLSSGDADSGSTSADGGGADMPPEAEAGAGSSRHESDKPEAPHPADGAAVVSPIRLDPDRFGTQVTRLRDRADAYRTAEATTSPSAPADDDSVNDLLRGLSAYADQYRSTCPTAGWGRGRAVPVRYDRQPGVLVFRPVRGDTQVVDLFLCGSDHAERSITLPAP